MTVHCAWPSPEPFFGLGGLDLAVARFVTGARNGTARKHLRVAYSSPIRNPCTPHSSENRYGRSMIGGVVMIAGELPTTSVDTTKWLPTFVSCSTLPVSSSCCANDLSASW